MQTLLLFYSVKTTQENTFNWLSSIFKVYICFHQGKQIVLLTSLNLESKDIKNLHHIPDHIGLSNFFWHFHQVYAMVSCLHRLLFSFVFLPQQLKCLVFGFLIKKHKTNISKSNIRCNWSLKSPVREWALNIIYYICMLYGP